MIIGLSGYAGSGKSTAALALVSEFGFRRLKFAAPLKAMLRSFLKTQGAKHSTIESMIEGDLKNRPTRFLNGATPRHAMQTLGTEWGRNLIHPDLWVEAAMRDVWWNVVYDDIRYSNEVAAVRIRGGMVFRIERPGVGPASDHSSEQLPDCDAVIINDSDPGAMLEQMRRIWS